MGIDRNKRKRQTFIRRLKKVLEGYGAWQENPDRYPHEYSMYSIAGKWSINMRDDTGFVFTRFEHPEVLQGTLVGANIYSGKYNLHFIQTEPADALAQMIRLIHQVVPIDGDRN